MVTYKEISNYPGYRVGDDGSFWTRQTTNAKLYGPWREMAICLDRDGYRKALLCQNCIRRHTHVNVLVLETFVGAAPPNLVCGHRDGNRLNNALYNLRWITRKENGEDMIKHGNSSQGVKQNKAKLTDTLVVEIRRRRFYGESCVSIGNSLGVSKDTISSICNFKTWTHVT